jgi:seryl-tRNA synthetase
MLQLQVLRQNPAWVKERLAIKNFVDLKLVDTILSLDDERKKLQLDFDNTQAKVNSLSKEIGQLMAKGQKEEAEANKKLVTDLKATMQPITEKLGNIEQQLHDELVKLPNLPSEKVPAGKSPADNVVVREGGQKPQLPQGRYPTGNWQKNTT